MKGRKMINLEYIKENFNKEKINTYVEPYLEIFNQLRDIEAQWIEETIDDKEFEDILDMYDYLTENITKYFISNYYNRDVLNEKTKAGITKRI